MKTTTSKSVKPSGAAASSKVMKTAAREVRLPLKKSLNQVKWEFPLTKNNYIILAIGIVVLTIGYIFLASGVGDNQPVEGGKWANPLAIEWAPVLLVIGYCVIIPFGILKFFGKKKEADTESQS
jgi:hypothetical protein